MTLPVPRIPWTDGEADLLSFRRRDGASVDALAFAFSRTAAAIEQKLLQLRRRGTLVDVLDADRIDAAPNRDAEYVAACMAGGGFPR